MRVLICGGREWSNVRETYAYLDRLHKRLGISCVIEGDAPGADRMAGFWARKNRITNKKYPANWAKDGKAAGPRRNQRMLDDGKPELVIAFPGGAGTRDMMDRAERAGVHVVRFPDLAERDPAPNDAAHGRGDSAGPTQSHT